MVDNNEYAVNAFFMSDHEVTNAWNNIDEFLEPMANTYFWHPTYDNYPVVTITTERANLYCEWLTTSFKTKYGDHTNLVRLTIFLTPLMH